MNAIRSSLTLFLVLFLLPPFLFGQVEDQDKEDNSLPRLFREESPLPLQLRYSNKEIKRETNDSTYLQSRIWYRETEQWDSLPVRLRARGNFRRKTCYFAPLKLKFRRSSARNTVFEGSETLKLVLPCLLERNSGDYVLKEYLAYKLYQVIAPYHFKTRLLEIALFDDRGRREVDHHFFGFLIEDMDQLTVRYGGQEVRRYIHPLQQDDLASVRNAFFEYMIANTDFSTKQLHNQKLLFEEKRIIPLPYDFDMSGLVNAPYAAVTNIQNLSGTITHVTDRIYKGYERERPLLDQVRNEYLEKKPDLLGELYRLKELFEDQAQYREASDFLLSFFAILEDDKKFEREIATRLRTR
jgi:hypothetical protein